jgi:hypothetical protein
MSESFSESELEAYLDEGLTPDEMARVEAALRADSALLEQLARINRRRDQGMHTLGAIWRRHRISCPARELLGSFLLGVLDPEEAEYVEFHVTEIGCRVCQANLEDLRKRQQQSTDDLQRRRRRYYQTSATYLRR